jgi:oligopeptide/dipeptide ABC transporter ATP-binding protein
VSDSSPSSLPPQPLLAAEGVKVQFRLRSGSFLTAVDGVDLAIGPGEICGLVGESGCGKTVFSLALLSLISRSESITEGRVLWRGKDLRCLSERELRNVRGKEIAMIFQNPQASLNPVRKIGAQLLSVIRLHRPMSKAEAWQEALRLLRVVRFADAERILESYSYQVSGGMCQRIMIAMALSCNPRLLIADEPTSSLDVTVQAQIMELLLEIRERYGTSILLISHDLGVIARLCDRVAVMYLGRIIEWADASALYSSPMHPYTQALLRSIPIPDPSRKEPLEVLGDEVPSPVQISENCCRFRGRCPEAFERCERIDPSLRAIGTGCHEVACLLYESA